MTGQGDSFELRDAAVLMEEECWLVLWGGYYRGSLGKNDEGVGIGVKVVDHNVTGRVARDGEETGLIGQGTYLLVRYTATTTL